MAYSNLLTNVTKNAAVTLAAHKYKIVELTSADEVQLAALGHGYGIVQNVPGEDEAATVAISGHSKAHAADTVSVGNLIKVQSGGLAVAVVSGDAHAADFVTMGRAMTAAASGALFTLELNVGMLINVASGDAMPF